MGLHAWLRQGRGCPAGCQNSAWQQRSAERAAAGWPSYIEPAAWQGQGCATVHRQHSLLCALFCMAVQLPRLTCMVLLARCQHSPHTWHTAMGSLGLQVSPCSLTDLTKHQYIRVWLSCVRHLRTSNRQRLQQDCALMPAACRRPWECSSRSRPAGAATAPARAPPPAPPAAGMAVCAATSPLKSVFQQVCWPSCMLVLLPQLQVPVPHTLHPESGSQRQMLPAWCSRPCS